MTDESTEPNRCAAMRSGARVVTPSDTFADRKSFVRKKVIYLKIEKKNW